MYKNMLIALVVCQAQQESEIINKIFKNIIRSNNEKN